MSGFAVRVLVSLAVAALAACGGGEGASPKKTSDGGKITGLVVKGVVQNATVTAYRLDASLTRGAALGYGPTGADGTFSLSVPPYNGPVEVVANGGTYLEEAVGVPVQLTRELSSVIPSFQSGSTASVTLTPVSSIAASFARAEVSRGALLADAVASAWTHVNNHFGGLDWRTITPTDLTPNDPVTVTMSDATKAGLVLAGLSQSARVLSESSGLSPGTSVTGATLAGAAVDDARDGTLNGVGPGGALSQGSVGLTGQTLRRSLGQAVLQFVQSDRNHTQLTGADVLSLATAVAANSDPYLFCPNQIANAGCAGGPIELTPAAIAFVDPPTFVGTTTVTLKVTASQPVAGVSAVYAQTAAAIGQVPGVLADGVWTIAGIPLVEGPNIISVWGVDGAGGGSIANAATLTITRDTVPPAPYAQAAAPAYYDERAMVLAGATVPAQYRFPEGATKVAPIMAGGIYKSTARLAWTTTPSPAVLETTNPDNTPYIQFAVPVGNTQAPIASATYSIRVGEDTKTGNLLAWQSPASSPTTAYFDVPLSANIVPAIATSTGTLTVGIAATFVDAAGNTGEVGPINVPYAVIAPPLLVQEDTAYGTYNDPKSAFPYTRATNTYLTLWNPAQTVFFGGEVRLVRYVVTNPSAVPVAISPTVTQGAGGSWRGVEEWTAFTNGMVRPSQNTYPQNAASYSFDGFRYTDRMGWCAQSSPGIGGACRNADNSYCSCTDNSFQGSFPCPAGTYAAHMIGTSTRWSCVAQTRYTGTIADVLTLATGDLLARGFKSPQQGGGEVTPADTFQGRLVVPAATGSVAGALVIYITHGVPSARPIPLTWNALTSNNRYENKESEYWVYGYSLSNYGGVQMYSAYNGLRHLSAATEQLAGTLAVSAQGFTGDALALVGSPSAAFSAALDRAISH